MKTSKAVSTISYNTLEFLIDKLEELRKAKILEFWFFIWHEPEEDEKKGHFHVWMQPARLLQTMDLAEQFIEFVPGESDPRKTIKWKSSKQEDAFLYWLHNPDYLAAIGESRKYHYDISEIYSPDPDELDEIARDAYRYLAEQFGKVRLISDKIREGLTDEQILTSMNIPLQATLGYLAFIKSVRSALNTEFSRNGRKGHEEDES